jgi:ATP-binding cassette, subfamily B, bacterial
MRKVQEYRIKSRIAEGHVASFINELFGSIQAVKVASAEMNLIRQFDKINTIGRKTVLRDVVFFNTMNVAFQSTTTIGIGIILIIAGKQFQNGSFSIGDLALFIFYFQYISEWSASSGTLIARFGQMNVSIKRMLALINNKNQEDLIKFGPIYMKNESLEVPTIEKTPNDLLNILEVEDLSYRYPNSEKGIKNVSFSIKRQSLTIITGRIGSGKTTLL